MLLTEYSERKSSLSSYCGSEAWAPYLFFFVAFFGLAFLHRLLLFLLGLLLCFLLRRFLFPFPFLDFLLGLFLLFALLLALLFLISICFLRLFLGGGRRGLDSSVLDALL